MARSGLFSIVFRIFFALLVMLMAYSSGSHAQNKKKVEILQSDLLDFDQRIVANAQRLLGNVKIRVDGALMWCDSLYSYNNNTVDAFGHVHIIRGDTLDMYADFIKYNGDTKLAKARRNVRLIDKQVTLTTDSLDYAMEKDLASYHYSGTIKDSTNVLNSVVGLYYVNEKKAYFRKNVDVVTKDYKIKSDTLIYYTSTKKVFLEGPTHIFNEADTLYAEYGWYDSMKSYARLTKKPRMWNDKRALKADSVFYDKEKGEGLAMGHARVQDIENRLIVVGNKVHYNDLTKIAWASDSAVLIQYSEKDSLYLHADYLRTMPDTTTTKKLSAVKKAVTKAKLPVLPDTLTVEAVVPDSLAVKKVEADSVSTQKPKDPRLVLAYHKVRFFREDFQGKCDSLVYWSKDSTVQLFTDPVIWSGKNQMTANFIEMINKSKDRDEVRMKEDAFIISMEDDSLRFNQIKGKNMNGFIRKNNLYKIDVNGNGQSNYYARDKDGIIGLNKAESSRITIYMNEGKVQKIAFIKSPDGELKPMANIEEVDKLLPGFKWLEELRPQSKDDIFLDPVPATPKLPGKVIRELKNKVEKSVQ
jgi:lipopolysaccharide export system protein LptA